MRIKELHLRNIASIESADIDFEKGLNDGITGDPASIFLITGDTGAGKSVILDGISMALYKTTPRLASVSNVNNNSYFNTDGEEIRVCTIQQYTRLGISPKDPSYSMVVFEGNDGQQYIARLSLGIYLGKAKKDDNQNAKTNKESERPLKYCDPKWEVKVGDGDFTTDNVEQTILNAVGLTFEQFGRMAMLAQGQFAAFLTGDKKERAEILEQLTNTQHFTAYGEAINRLFKKAEEQKKTFEIQAKEANSNPLAQIEVGSLQEEAKKLQGEKLEVEQKVTQNSTTLKLLDSVQQNETALSLAQQEKQHLEEFQNTPEYQQNKSLVEQWDRTDHERQQLSRLKEATIKTNEALVQLNLLHTPFIQLSEDLEHRLQIFQQQDDQLYQLYLWIEERKGRDELYTKHEAGILKMKDFASKSLKLQDLDIQLKTEQGKLAQLEQNLKEAKEKAQNANEVVNEKRNAIDKLVEQRTNLNPSEINRLLTQSQGKKSSLEILQKAIEQLAESQKATQQLKDEIATAREKLKALEDQKKEAEEEYQKKKNIDEEAKQRLTTMRMSVNDTLVELRKRLEKEHTTTCPLCGQHITQLHVEDDFRQLLTPLEAEQQQSAKALENAEAKRNQAVSVYHKAEGELNSKNNTLKDKEKHLFEEQNKVQADASNAGLDIQQPLAAQIPIALDSIELEIKKLKDSQKQTEDLQNQINKLLEKKKPLDEAKSKADKVHQQAQNTLDTNHRDIQRLQQETDELKTDLDNLEKDITAIIAGCYPEWKSNVTTTCEQLRQEAETYLGNKNKYEKAKNSLENYRQKTMTIQGTQSRIMAILPKWKTTFSANPSPSQNVLNDWTKLLAEVSKYSSSVTYCEQTIHESQTFLEAYYAQSGTVQEQLEALLNQSGRIDQARKAINENSTALKSNLDAIARYQEQITEAMAKMDITQQEELPNRTILEEEGKALQAQLEQTVGRIAQIKKQLDDYVEFEKHLADINKQLGAAMKVYNKWETMNRYFGGNRFRTLVQTYILRPLLNNANIYLEKITDRYTLTCSEDNEQLAILVLDRYNKNQVRSVTVLSGGERFMISLALSLALSSLNRPDMNINILFIDEGFGTLDEHCLDSVMSTLEKLQDIAGQSNRRVGIISHREELEERIPVKIKVKKQGEGRSCVEIEKNA